ncbi:DNA replication/repair protein RecF [Paludicola sp. MB14-C6]|uniref:DNA replication/repair protein RecF n=1 Tax=Paludihabitans sp. MB14-C6 TaxID=3070656 RepID=UPI0027DD9DC3|nr:DNA replication/repair protein RecF [Paludicola sp. MB14-C6]WMJ21791.1 DNA replication/repair protein RecF [Paludicola sp. MB14-C6]
MKLNEIKLENFRNIEKMVCNPCESVNIIYGDNAQGKTNLIESIWLFTGNQSFRGSKMSELIQFNQQQTKITILFSDKERQQNAEFSIGSKKNITVNHIPLKKQSELNGVFYAVVFSPSHLSLIKDGPQNRRKFIDIAVSQIKPQYDDYLSKYEKILEQRNAFLKYSNRYPNLEQDIDIWDIQLSKIGTILSIYRNDYIKKLLSFSQLIYKGLSSKKEEFFIQYISTIYENMDEITVYDDKQVEQYYNKLKETYHLDVKLGYTTCGIHRDDLEITINGHSVKNFGSQGQQRSSVIALKLSEAGILKKATGENPIILLDDVMSELDEKRQDYILNHVKEMQVFITCCDVSNTEKLKNGRVFHIQNGEINEVYDIKT